jgi:hypothetical protein
MIAKYYGKAYSAEMLRKRCFISREGVSRLGISDAVESTGFRTVGVQISFHQLANMLYSHAFSIGTKTISPFAMGSISINAMEDYHTRSIYQTQLMSELAYQEKNSRNVGIALETVKMKWA